MAICNFLSAIDFELIKGVISIIGTIGALSLGIIGLTTWNRQLRGTNKYELAKKTILKSYEVQQALQLVRSPMLMLNKEEVEAGRKLGEEQRIYSERLKGLIDKWNELQAIRFEVKVVFGEKYYDSFNNLETAIKELQGAIWLHFWMKGAYAGPGATVDNSPDRVKENNKFIYYISDEDEFSKSIIESINCIEKHFESKVR